MHPFATDSEERKLVLFVLALVSLFATWLLHVFISWIGQQTNFSPPWWLEIPSVLTFYGIFYEMFDRWIWKMRIVKQVGLVRIPDLGGTWKGYLKTSYDDFKEEHQASLKIFQSWTRIGISQQAQSSKGESFAASILTKEPEAKRLFFMYRNTPQADSDPNLHQHIGSAQLILAGGILSGDYYNCARDRPTYGTLHFEKETSRSHRSNCTH
jgi:hypothetical protein